MNKELYYEIDGYKEKIKSLEEELEEANDRISDLEIKNRDLEDENEKLEREKEEAENSLEDFEYMDLVTHLIKKNNIDPDNLAFQMDLTKFLNEWKIS